MSHEKRFPTFRFVVYYAPEHVSKYDGKANESLSFDKMYPATPSHDELMAQVHEFWRRNLQADRYSRLPSLADQGCVLVGYEIGFVGFETWCQGWFSHYTLNVHLSDDTILESFARFVESKRQAHWNLQHDYRRDDGKDYYCLMGAEDGWRWRGPCRCEHCQAQGIVRIDH